MSLAWVPYADRAEAERRLNGIPAGLELDFYLAQGDEFPGTIDEVAFYVLPYMKGPAVLARASATASSAVLVSCRPAALHNVTPGGTSGRNSS